MPEDLANLEARLSRLSHHSEALQILQDFSKKLGKTKHRQIFFSQEGVLVRKTIIYQDLLEKGLIDPDEDPFSLLQGDIVSTDTAYLLGERLANRKFVIATSTCDLIPQRRQYAALLQIQPLTADTPNVKQLLGELLAFRSTQRMYLPRLPNDSPNVLGNAVVFDGIIQIKLEDLLLATRHASLSLVGWRIFGALVRTILVRAGDSEVRMRMSLNS